MAQQIPDMDQLIPPGGDLGGTYRRPLVSFIGGLPIGTFATLTHTGAIVDTSYSYQVPSNAFTINYPNGCSLLYLDPAAGLASGTINMPTTPVDGQICVIASSQTITALTVNASAGQAISNTPTALTVSTTGSYNYAFLFRVVGLKWFRLV